MNELYELRIYPKPSDVYEKDGKYIALPDRHTLEECEEIIDSRQYDGICTKDREIIAVDKQGNRYFSPRDGFGWMDVTKAEEI